MASKAKSKNVRICDCKMGQHCASLAAVTWMVSSTKLLLQWLAPRVTALRRQNDRTSGRSLKASGKNEEQLSTAAAAAAAALVYCLFAVISLVSSRLAEPL